MFSCVGQRPPTLYSMERMRPSPSDALHALFRRAPARYAATVCWKDDNASLLLCSLALLCLWLGGILI
ncbi:hypothetical protein GUJ93_ZPchr0001g32642 [Zizania palustris]|uniref:Uncharacterized protein n=1 Tax=Zizania palustris TaxID=103762 RepID=A0A8J5V8R9_ZIZPA|nr:hypothetical protein GUJ93_ZPchr0001g32642 [Zizania palustris]